jgi:hypothetical protein
MTNPKTYISSVFRNPSAFFFEQGTHGLRNMEYVPISISCGHERQTDGQIVLSLEPNNVKRWNVKDCPHGAERLQELLAVFVDR